MVDLHSVEGPGNVFLYWSNLLYCLNYFSFFFFFFFILAAVVPIASFWQVFFLSALLVLGLLLTHWWKCQLTWDRWQGHRRSRTHLLHFFSVVFFSRGGVGLCLWLANGWEPFWLEQSIVEKCMKLYALPFSQILRKICHCQLLRNTLTKKV